MARKNKTGWGYVYVIKSSDSLYKIGLAKDVARRLSEHQRHHSEETLEVVTTIETEDMLFTERQLHNLFSRKRVYGEWFSLDDGDFELIDRIKRGIQAYIDELR